MNPDRRRAAPRARTGLTLMEVVVVVAIILILTAALTPTLLGVFDRKRIDAARESIDALVTGLSEMRLDNQDWPSRLSHLVTPITTSNTNICGANYSTGKVGQWAGPYLARGIPAAGFPIGIGTVQDLLVREIISGNDSYLKIQINDVSEADALELDRLYDADGSAAGALRWTAPGPTGLVTVFFLRPIRGC